LHRAAIEELNVQTRADFGRHLKARHFHRLAIMLAGDARL
jgi:hypothetical protein